MTSEQSAPHAWFRADDQGSGDGAAEDRAAEELAARWSAQISREEEMTSDEAENILGGSTASADQATRVTAGDAMRALGGSPREQRAAAETQRRPNKREAFADAREALGASADRGGQGRNQRRRNDRGGNGQRTAEHNREWLATGWRYLMLSKCGRHKEQARLVALLEDFLDGTEDEVPTWIKQSVDRIIEADNRKPAEARPGIPWPELYRRLAEAYHREPVA